MTDYNFKIMSCNLKGIRAAKRHGFLDVVKEENPDIICVQDLKTNLKNIPNTLRNIPGYESYFYESNTRGQKGVGIYTKIEPNDVFEGLGVEIGNEGRLLRLDFNDFIIISSFIPSGGKEKITYKLDFLDRYIEYLKDLIDNQEKDIIVCGDFNIAHDEKDLYDKRFRESGFKKEERERIDRLLNIGFKDAFREINPDLEQVSFASYQYRKKGEDYKGLRLDYFFINERLLDKVTNCRIKDYHISDHNPIFLELKF